MQVETELAEIKGQLQRIESLMASISENRTQPQPQTLPLSEFCRRLNRSKWWGYEQIKARKIIPSKTGKPFQVPVEQLSNFIPQSRKAT